MAEKRFIHEIVSLLTTCCIVQDSLDGLCIAGAAFSKGLLCEEIIAGDPVDMTRRCLSDEMNRWIIETVHVSARSRHSDISFGGSSIGNNERQRQN